MSGSSETAYIALGSNIGSREENLDRSINMLKETDGIEVTAVSAYYNTAPVGYTEQPDFLNAVVKIETSLTPEQLLEACRHIEKELKRERIIHWGPRTIDLDILLYGKLVLESESLTVPHPRMHEREFVLEPLNEIAPRAVHPVFGKTVREMYEAVKNQV